MRKLQALVQKRVLDFVVSGILSTVGNAARESTSHRLRNKLYYLIKPLIPRRFQIALRRSFVRRKLPNVSDVWPIHQRSGEKPPGWSGWPSQRRFALVLTHDIEGMRGVHRCVSVAEMERRLGFWSSFNFVPERYGSWPEVRHELDIKGFEVGVHDLRHDGRLFESERAFLERAPIINKYLHQWDAVGFRSGSMFHRLEWIQELNIEYDASTFDSDPFEPQSDGMHTIFPMWIARKAGGGYVELPYTLPQDMTIFVILQHSDLHVWKDKLEWIASRGGMALVNTHPDYMHADGEKPKVDEYAFDLYREFLEHVRSEYCGQYWNALARDVARFIKGRVAGLN